MGSATDKELAELHAKVAKAMSRALDSSDRAETLLNEYEDELPAPVVMFLEHQINANPSLLTAITKFLKDNEITAQREESTEMTELEERLQKKKSRVRVGNVVPITDEE